MFIGGRYMNKRIFRFMLALVLGIFVSAFSYGVSTAHAAENTADSVVVEEGQVALADSASEDGGGAMILLMGGMLILIIAVVITVVASFVVTAPIADEV
jgi:hypothetical protein